MKNLASLTAATTTAHITDTHSFYAGVINGENVTNERRVPSLLLSQWLAQKLSTTFAPHGSTQGDNTGYSTPAEVVNALNQAVGAGGLGHTEWQHRDHTAADIISLLDVELGTGWKTASGGTLQSDLETMDASEAIGVPAQDTIYKGSLTQNVDAVISEITANVPIALSFWVTQDGTGNHAFTLSFSGTDNVTYNNDAAPVVAQAANKLSIVNAVSYKFDGEPREWFVYLAGDDG